MNLPKRVMIKEVGPRDGLQNEKRILSTENKIAWINQLARTGLTYIEASSFVHPKWIPALADADEVFQGINRQKGVTYAALVPNIQGLNRALEANVDEINVFLSASETHNQKNVNRTISQSLDGIKVVVRESRQAGKKVRGYVSTVFGCPYEGKVNLNHVKRIMDSLFTMGVYEISLGDTIGIANPIQVEQIGKELIRSYPAQQLAMHFHDTYGRALVNILVSMQLGIITFDSSYGGLGGCPYAPGASGNVATNDLVNMLHEMGIETGIDEETLQQARSIIERKVKSSLPSHVLQATL